MAAKKSDNHVEKAGEHDQLEAYFHYRQTGSNDLGYIEPTRDQEIDVAPERGVDPGATHFNPEPPKAVQLRGEAHAASSLAGRTSVADARPFEEKEEAEEEFLEAEVRPNVEVVGADEDGNLKPDASLPVDVQRVVVMDADELREENKEVAAGEHNEAAKEAAEKSK